MAKRILQIVQTAYRATLEEQDDPVLWLTQVLRGSGSDTHVLLRGNATNYTAKGQDPSGLSFGGRAQTQPPRIEADLARLSSKGASIYVVEEDLAALGLRRDEIIDGLTLLRSAALPDLLRTFDQVWQW